MTDREKLVELLEATTYEALGGNLVVKGFATAKEFVDHLIANGVTANNWRDAKTDPPKEWKGADEHLINYMVCCPEYGVDVGNYVEPAQCWVVMGLPAPVTHWMPLPEAPKEE